MYLGLLQLRINFNSLSIICAKSHIFIVTTSLLHVLSSPIFRALHNGNQIEIFQFVEQGKSPMFAPIDIVSLP